MQTIRSDRELVVSIFSITLFPTFCALIRARTLPRYSFHDWPWRGTFFLGGHSSPFDRSSSWTSYQCQASTCLPLSSRMLACCCIWPGDEMNLFRRNDMLDRQCLEMGRRPRQGQGFEWRCVWEWNNAMSLLFAWLISTCCKLLPLEHISEVQLWTESLNLNMLFFVCSIPG